MSGLLSFLIQFIPLMEIQMNTRHNKGIKIANLSTIRRNYEFPICFFYLVWILSVFNASAFIILRLSLIYLDLLILNFFNFTQTTSLNNPHLIYYCEKNQPFSKVRLELYNQKCGRLLSEASLCDAKIRRSP